MIDNINDWVFLYDTYGAHHVEHKKATNGWPQSASTTTTCVCIEGSHLELSVEATDEEVSSGSISVPLEVVLKIIPLRTINVLKKDKIIKDLTGMKERYKMYDSTKDAFLTRAVCYLSSIDIDGKNLYPMFFGTVVLPSGIRGGNCQDEDIIREQVDEKFANEVVNAALEMIEK